MRAASYLLITCEHGGNRVPPEYRARFAALGPALASHRGFDAGALVMARDLARSFGAPLIHSTITRLLIDLNRSSHHRNLCSEALTPLAPDERARIVHRWHNPYWKAVDGQIRAAVASGMRAVHVSSHSFTPILDGEVRTADIGLLYDPVRPGEADLARLWQQELQELAPSLRVRRNYPYRGKNDGLTTHLRREFPASKYVGIELEVNQALMGADARSWRDVRSAVVAALRAAVGPNSRSTRAVRSAISR